MQIYSFCELVVAIPSSVSNILFNSPGLGQARQFASSRFTVVLVFTRFYFFNSVFGRLGRRMMVLPGGVQADDIDTMRTNCESRAFWLIPGTDDIRYPITNARYDTNFVIPPINWLY